jgi:hypothetical protein
MKENVYGQTLAFDQFFKTRVAMGMVYGTATTASVQATGTGAFNYRLNLGAAGIAGSPAGIIIIDGVVSQVAAEADISVDSGTTGNAILADGQSIIYAIYYYRTPDGTVRRGIYKGAVALLAAVVAPTDAQIEAAFAPGTVYLRVLNFQVNRTGDVNTHTFVYNHLVRNLQRPATVQNP